MGRLSRQQLFYSHIYLENTFPYKRDILYDNDVHLERSGS